MPRRSVPHGARSSITTRTPGAAPSPRCIRCGRGPLRGSLAVDLDAIGPELDVILVHRALVRETYIPVTAPLDVDEVLRARQQRPPAHRRRAGDGNAHAFPCEPSHQLLHHPGG